MKALPPLLLPACLLFASCANRPLIYTGTQLGVHVQGVKENVPEKVTFGYDRGEFGWFPNGSKASVKGSFDGEFSPLAGLAISDTLATGAAAGGDVNGGSNHENDCMLVSTTSKFNLGIEAGNPDGVSPSFNAGFKRSIFALFPGTTEDLPSTYTDISVHASGLTGKISSPKGIPDHRELKSDAGVRVVQTIAMGPAAKAFVENNKTAVAASTTADIGKTP